MAISAEDKNFLVSLYVGYFNRAPDPAGLQFWIDQVEAGRDTNTIAADFAASPEAKSLYPFLTTPDVSSPTSFITAVYANLFNRAPDAAGQAFWEAQLSSGAVSPADAIDAIIKGATTAPDATILANKNIVGLDFATDAGNTPGFTFDLDGASGSAAKDAISGVTEDSATVTAAQAATDAYLSGVASPGQTFTLTENADTLVGTANDDVFNAPVIASGGVAAQPTLNPLDNIDGGSGTDTLILETTGGTVVQGTFSNIENLTLLGAGNVNNNTALNISSFSGTVELQQTNDTAVNLTNVSGQTIATDRVAAGTVVDTDSTATATALSLKSEAPVGNTTFNVDGAAVTSVSLAVDGTSTGSSVAIDNTDGVGGAIASDNTVKNVSIAASGNSTVSFDGTALEAVTITGKGTTSFTSTTAASKSVDASGSEGGATIGTAMANGALFTGGAGKDTITVGATTKANTMGAGDDTVNVNGNALGTGGSIDAGEGTDTLAMATANAAAASLTTAFEGSISNFETLFLNDNNTVTRVVDLANLDDLSNVKMAGTTASTTVAEKQTVQITSDADAQGGSVKFAGVDVAVGANATIDGIGAAIVGQTAAIKAANANIDTLEYDAVTDKVTVTYTKAAGDVGVFATENLASGATFGGLVGGNATEVTPGVQSVEEVQTIQITAGADANGGIINLSQAAGGAVVGTAILANSNQNEIAAQIAANKAAIIAANTAIKDITASGDTLTITYNAAAGNVNDAVIADAAAPNDTGATFGGVVTGATGNAGTGEVQTFTVTGGTDATGGNIIIGGVAFDLAANLTIDQVGVAIAAETAALKAGINGLDTVAFNAANDTVTLTYLASAGDVAQVAVADSAGASFGAVVDNATAYSLGVAGGDTTLNNFATGGTLELSQANAGVTTVNVKDAATTAADTVTVAINGAAQLNNSGTLTIANVETVNVTTSDTTLLTDPTAASSLNLTATAATAVNVSGNHGVNFTGSTLGAVKTFDASGVTATGAAGASTFLTSSTNLDVTLTGGAGNDVLSGASTTDATKVVTISGNAGNDIITGGAGKDVLSGGDGNDVITGGANADNLTGGAGNDIFDLNAISESVLANRDVITDFSANTFGNGTAGAAGTGAAIGSQGNFTGDVIDVRGLAAGGTSAVDVSVQANAADAQTFIQNQSGGTNAIGAALDSTTGLLYIDVTNDGVIDSVIELTGVTTIDAAAFLVA